MCLRFWRCWYKATLNFTPVTILLQFHGYRGEKPVNTSSTHHILAASLCPNLSASMKPGPAQCRRRRCSCKIGSGLLEVFHHGLRPLSRFRVHVAWDVRIQTEIVATNDVRVKPAVLVFKFQSFGAWKQLEDA